MLRVGLTGGIGAGKSTVAARLAELGAVVVDSDKIAREVVEPGTSGLAEVVEAFGEQVLTPEGALDRPALAARVFGDDQARARLNAIIHPRVRDRAVQLSAAAPADGIVVQDIPLLVENGMAPAFHLVIVVDAEVEQRVHRLTTARGMAEADARARIAAQATPEQRRAAADVWLDNSGTPEQVLAAVDELWAARLLPYEANVRLGRYSPRGAPELVPYDPSWPEQAARVAARIGLATGKRVDHIGSTSVPGLAAKDVLDLQLTVESLAEADALAAQLGQAGFPVVPGLVQDTPKDGEDPGDWLKRTHCGADPGRWVNLHLRVAGSPGWRFALLFPAWLRADPAARAEYESVKRELAARCESIAEYGDAKDPWFAKAHARAGAWAEGASWSPPG
ncbi:dephospho-CoA kinase [Kutzneria albida]|uniref:Dephospho-CoA kinase n=1 Tax=Kutzneria albida DSM 43870 TaxID=1449976 RepID=W5W422_9PSEU|nr:dephospho-CoA kinase [Kutzneria albida]AHH95988.1 Dephospho-CoA kinase [Kutzneria albida DSM 43870]